MEEYPNISKYVSHSLNFNPYDNEILDVEAVPQQINETVIEKPERIISIPERTIFENSNLKFRENFNFSNPYYEDENDVEKDFKRIFDLRHEVSTNLLFVGNVANLSKNFGRYVVGVEESYKEFKNARPAPDTIDFLKRVSEIEKKIKLPLRIYLFLKSNGCDKTPYLKKRNFKETFEKYFFTKKSLENP